MILQPTPPQAPRELSAGETWMVELIRINPRIQPEIIGAFAITVFGMMLSGKFNVPRLPTDWKQLWDSWLVASHGGMYAEENFRQHIGYLAQRAMGIVDPGVDSDASPKA